MVISDIEYTEEVAEASELEGGKSKSGSNSWTPVFQSFFQAIYPAASASVINLGGTSIGNTAISMNITMPILIAINGAGSSVFGYPGYRGNSRSSSIMPFSFW